jgi:hypothetical protein
MKLQDLSEGDSITIDFGRRRSVRPQRSFDQRTECEPLSGRSWQVIESTVVNIGIAEYPLVVASERPDKDGQIDSQQRGSRGSETVRLTEMDGGEVEAVTESSMNHIDHRAISRS